MTADLPATDALWQGIRVALDRLEEAGVDPMLIADALLLGTRAHGQTLLADVRPLVESAGWEMPPLVENAPAHGVVTAASFTFYAQRLAERMQLEVVAVPVDAPVSAVSAAVAPLYARRTWRRVTRVVAESVVADAAPTDGSGARNVARYHVEVRNFGRNRSVQTLYEETFDDVTIREDGPGACVVECRREGSITRYRLGGVAPVSGPVELRWMIDAPGETWRGIDAQSVTRSVEAA